MEIIEDAKFQAYLLKQIEERMFHERTGVHQSDLNFCLNKQALRRAHPEANTEKETLLFSLGWSTQGFLTGQSEDVPEVEIDGIIVTVDALACPKCGKITNGRS